jgi:hypothetical protein
MQYRLDTAHHIDEQVLDAGTVIGDDTRWPFRSLRDERKPFKNKLGKEFTVKRGDPLPPSSNMTPLDDEARRLWSEYWGDDKEPGFNADPTQSIPLTGAPGAPKVQGPAVHNPAARPQPAAPNPKPEEAPKTGINSQASPPAKPLGYDAGQAGNPPSVMKEGPKSTPATPTHPTDKK